MLDCEYKTEHEEIMGEGGDLRNRKSQPWGPRASVQTRIRRTVQEVQRIRREDARMKRTDNGKAVGPAVIQCW